MVVWHVQPFTLCVTGLELPARSLASVASSTQIVATNTKPGSDIGWELL